VSVTQFIRTPQWVRTVENPRYSWALRKFTTALPRFGDWLHDRRLQAFQQSDPRGLKYGDWRRFRGYGRRRAIEAFHEDLNTIKDPELRAKMTPHEMPGCKRIPLANDYYEVIQQPNVTIHRGGIRKIVPEGIVTDDGNLHELDVIVYATGFDSHAYFNPIRVVGRDGASLGDLWKGGPFSYRGIMVPGFPNIFVIHGPYTPVNNISVPLATEDQLGYVMEALETSRLDNIAFSPTEEATDRYLRWIRSSLPGTTWGSKQCANWYTAADGYVLIFPFGRDEHKALYDSFDREDCEIEVCAANGAGISAEATQPSGR
jgi:cation diffusion facilitator CzcD-associated flavoprotein CzcO